MTTPHEATIDTVYAAGAPRIASLRITEGEPDGQTIDWSLGPITAISRRPRPAGKDLYEIWPTGLHTVIRVEAGTPAHFTLQPDTLQPPPAPHHPAAPPPQPVPVPQQPQAAPGRAPWLPQHPAPHHTTYPPPTGQPYPPT